VYFIVTQNAPFLSDVTYERAKHVENIKIRNLGNIKLTTHTGKRKQKWKTAHS